MTPYKGDMTFPPSQTPVYAATSFNGRPVSSLRAGMIRISRPFFLSVCRYIQQLMVGLSTSIEEEDRHPALSESTEGEFRLQRSPSTDTLSKLVEKQSEQHLELMERLSQVSICYDNYIIHRSADSNCILGYISLLPLPGLSGRSGICPSHLPIAGLRA